uniref:Succinate dehydrogenase assembly factor 3 n=1 Tax=Rhabditophanes sp. KR3021 TaxID=114890 RepID=A0AC35TL93_9BILA
MASLPNPAKFPLILYKRILRLHYGLPPDFKQLGDVYVKDEFRRHKEASKEHTLVFLRSWTEYTMMLSKQLTGKGLAKKEIGTNLNPELFSKMDNDKLHQLYELKVAALNLEEDKL